MLTASSAAIVAFIELREVGMSLINIFFARNQIGFGYRNTNLFGMHAALVFPCMGDVPLFPAPGSIRKEAPSLQGPERPISRHLAAKWLLRAEALAELPKLDRGTFHPYRRLWASERKGLPDVDVAHAAGWKDTRAMKVSYQQADPATVLRVVELEG